MVHSRALTGFLVTALVGSVLAAGSGPAAASRSAAVSGRPSLVPAHVFAPYFETYAATNLAAASARSGARFMTLAFLETPAVGSCELDWNGNRSTPVSRRVFGEDIRRIRAAGGDVVPSFGGYSADHQGRDIADSCLNVRLIAAAYERVVVTYGVTRLDLDVEDRSLTKPQGIDRRNKAIHLVQEWAAANERTVQFVYTLPTGTAGLDSTGVALLRNAVANHAAVQVVNVMTFDYYDGAEPHHMGLDTRVAAQAVLNQLHSVYPRESARDLWGTLGITEMIGIDDFGPPETFTIADARFVEEWAAGHGIAQLSFWALQRDNGGCPGTAGSDNCSGVSQGRWQFSRIFERFAAAPTGVRGASLAAR